MILKHPCYIIVNMILEIIKKIKKKYHLFKKSGKSKDKYGITLKKGDMFLNKLEHSVNIK